ncbi:MAG: helix-turn-helix transcriptional regulator [Cyanobacteria bacterium P01_H01_bin.58]
MQLVLNHRENWLLKGNPNDPRLLHADPSDEILIYPAYAGQGYRQNIRLSEDLTLVIMDYRLHQDMVFDIYQETACNKFAFPLNNSRIQQSQFISVLGFRELIAPKVRRQVFKVEVVFKHASMLTYGYACFDRLPPQTQQIVEGIAKSLWRLQGGCSILGISEILNRLIAYSPQKISSTHAGMALEQLLSDKLYAETVDLQYANRRPITPAMETVLGQILTCPYQGETRRAYLERKTLELVTLRLEAIAHPRLNEPDLNCIYEAAAILRSQLVKPPTVEALARKVGTNRLKLNQGFHAVYGTTPFSYLRDCRMGQARRLLMTTEMSVESIAAAVGYSSRNHFAKAFRRQAGLNPKAFQMQFWQWAS